MVEEIWDYPEQELKFQPLGLQDQVTLEALRALLPDGYYISFFDTCVVLDLYLDTQNEHLRAAGAGLRIRSRKKRKRLVLNFKPPSAETNGRLLRREVRTSYKSREL